MAVKKRMKADERRAQILDVARDCFVRHGFIGTTTALIAERADVTEPILYRHFPSKLELFFAILEETLDVAVRHFDELAAEAGTGAEKLLAIVRDYPDFSRRNRNLFNVVDRSAAADQNEKTRRLLENYYAAFMRALSSFVREGQKDGSIRKSLDADALGAFLTMAGIGFGFLDGLYEGKTFGPDFSDELVGLLQAMLKPR